MKHLTTALTIVFMLTAGLYTGIGVQAPDGSSTEEAVDGSSERSAEEALDILDRQPVVFTANQGQLDNDDVLFYAKGGSMWFSSDGVWFDVRDEDGGEGVVLKQEFRGGNDVEPMGLEPVGGVSNYFYGNDPDGWVTGVESYQEVWYPELYDGIDLRYYTNDAGPKYDLIVKPGADVAQIRVGYEGAEGVEVAGGGEVTVRTSAGDVKDGDLYVYQMGGKGEGGTKGAGGVREVDARFVDMGGGEYGFEVLQGRDTGEDLVIDPALGYSTFLGGSDWDKGNDIVVGPTGCSYIVGTTLSSDFSTTPGAYNTTPSAGLDAFVTMMDKNGTSAVFSSYLGGSGDEYGQGITLDAGLRPLVSGVTSSSDFPMASGAYDTTKGGQYDVFVAILSANGTALNSSTYLGGSSKEAHARVAIDGDGDIYLTGRTLSSDFPLTGGAYDSSGNLWEGFFTKLDQTLSGLVYSTYLGGTVWDWGYDICVDDDKSTTIVGATNSPDFPTTLGAYDMTHNGGEDIFVIQFNDTFSAQFSTYIGGSWDEQALGVDVDHHGDIYVTGFTSSPDFPVVSGDLSTTLQGAQDAFLLLLNSSAQSLDHSTYLGGGGWDAANDVELDGGGNVFVVGQTFSSDFPITPDAFQNNYNYSGDAFVSVLAGNCSFVVNSTYIGGAANENATALAIYDGDAIVIGNTSSTWFPTTSGAFDQTYNGNGDCFVTDVPTIGNQFYIGAFNIYHDGQNIEPMNRIYARNSSYSFRATVVYKNSLDKLAFVEISLDPWGLNSSYRLSRNSGVLDSFNTNSYCYLDSWYAYDKAPDKWVVDFNMTFNFTYPDEAFKHVRVWARDQYVTDTQMFTMNRYRVENDLVVNGTLSVRGSKDLGRELEDGDWVAPGEGLLFQGLMPVYQNTWSVFPPAGEFNVTVTDELNNSWYDEPIPAQKFKLWAQAPMSTGPSGITYYVNIGKIPSYCDFSNASITLHVNDTSNITFSNPQPSPSTWHTDANVTVGVNITDTGGGVVNGSSIQYSVSTDGGANWGGWTSLAYANSSTFLVSTGLIFPDGDDNHIRWRAWDTLGEGPAYSASYKVMVDTVDVAYPYHTPTQDQISYNANVTIGVIVTDAVSGVDASTIQYRTSTDSGTSWGSWTAVTGYSDGAVVNVSKAVVFPNGTTNRVQWRAYDVAGNGPTLSDEYTVKVNLSGTPPPPALTVKLKSPSSGAVLDKNSATLKWKLTNGSSTGVVYRVYLDTSYPPTSIQAWALNKTSLKVTGLASNITYYWTVIPLKGGNQGTCESGIWSFTVDVESGGGGGGGGGGNGTVNLISPGNGATLYSANATLSWAPPGNYTGWMYNVFMSKQNPPSSVLAFNIYNTSVKVSGLQDGKTYHWKVVPVSPSGPFYEYGSAIWDFDVDLGSNATYGVQLKDPGKKYIAQGSGDQFSLKAKNTGNVMDEYDLVLDPGSLGSAVYFTTGSSVMVSALSQGSIPLTVSIPVNTTPGIYDVELAAYSTGAESAGLNASDSVVFYIHVTQAVNQSVTGGPPGGGDGGGGEEDDEGGFWATGTGTAVKGLLVGAGVAAGVALATSPFWWVGFLFLLAPLMVRSKKGKADRKWRSKIYGAIVSKPGVHFNALKGWLEVSNGTLVYNLEMLERDGQIVSKRDGFFKKFYPVETELYVKPPEFLSMRDKIAIIIRDNPGAAKSEIAYLLDEDWHKVHYHVKKMTREGIVDREMADDGHPRFYLAETRSARDMRRKIFGKTVEVEGDVEDEEEEEAGSIGVR